MAKIVAIKKNRELSYEETAQLIDVTEQVIESDSGYRGINKRTKNARIPIKKSKKKPLSYWQKIYNRIIAKRRIKVENVIAEVKNFRILSHRYRNKRKGYNLKFNIIGGIVNLKNGFLNE